MPGVINDDEAVNKEEGSIGRTCRQACVRMATFRLHLVPEPAAVPAQEIERQPGSQRPRSIVERQPGQLILSTRGMNTRRS